VVVKDALKEYEAALQSALRVAPLSSNNWATQVPREAGVYVIWQAQTPVYVGESSSLRLRMRHFRQLVVVGVQQVCGKILTAAALRGKRDHASLPSASMIRTDAAVVIA